MPSWKLHHVTRTIEVPGQPPVTEERLAGGCNYIEAIEDFRLNEKAVEESWVVREPTDEEYAQYYQEKDNDNAD